jgi:hypothetical protein
MIKQKTYSIAERPDLRPFDKYAGRFQLHEPAECWDDLLPENKELCLQAADIIHKGFDDAKIYAFGSRVKGNFLPHSDLDILVQAAGFDRTRTLLLEGGIKVDCFPYFKTEKNLIQIP